MINSSFHFCFIGESRDASAEAKTKDRRNKFTSCLRSRQLAGREGNREGHGPRVFSTCGQLQQLSISQEKSGSKRCARRALSGERLHRGRDEP